MTQGNWLTEKDCKHSAGFRLMQLYIAGKPCYIFGCNCLCGYNINFDPEHFVDGVAILNEPSPDLTWKDPPELKSNEVDR